VASEARYRQAGTDDRRQRQHYRLRWATIGCFPTHVAAPSNGHVHFRAPLASQAGFQNNRPKKGNEEKQKAETAPRMQLTEWEALAEGRSRRGMCGRRGARLAPGAWRRGGGAGARGGRQAEDDVGFNNWICQIQTQCRQGLKSSAVNALTLQQIAPAIRPAGVVPC
jgi:hypothetical protein